MDKTGSTTAGRLPATLEAKIGTYQGKLLERLGATCKQYGISGETNAAIAEDIAAFLHYKDQPLHINQKRYKELRRQDFIQAATATTDDLPLAMLLQSYEDIDHTNDIISTLQQVAEPSRKKQLTADFREHFATSTPIAKAEIARQMDVVDIEAQQVIDGHLLFFFYLNAVKFSGATAEELIKVKPRLAPLTEKEREAVIKDALRAAADFDNAKRQARPSTTTSEAEEVAAIEIPDTPSAGEKTKKGGEVEEITQPVEEAVYIDEEKKQQQYYIIRQSYTRLLSRPLPVSFSTQGRQSTEPIRIRDLKQMPDLFKEQADKYGISETRIYQFLDALQIIAQEKGEKHFIRGYDYYFYDLTLPSIIRIGTGSDSKPNGRTIAEFWTAGWILSNIMIYVDEEVIKDYITDKDGKKKPITEPRETLIQMLNIPMITTAKKPKDKNAYTTSLTLQVHCFVKEGRTKKYIMDGELKRAIKLPPYDKVPKEEEDLARKLFNRKDTGIRFYNTLKLCYHKEEGDLLAQVFDYQRKKTKAQSEEQYKKVAESIKHRKWQDQQSLARMFERAKKYGILESYQRKRKESILTTKPIYIWEWRLKRRTEEKTDGAEE